MKVTIVGTHGIPARYGGFETFAEHLARACAEAGIEIRVINEKDNPVQPLPDNVNVGSSSYNKSSNPLSFYKESLKLAAADSDIILCCGVGGAFYYSGMKSFKGNIITNFDGMEHRRKKYSLAQRLTIFLLQKFAARRSHALIADSNEGRNYFLTRFPEIGNKIKMISYGADPCQPMDLSVLSECKLEKNEYFLVIARLVPENNIHEIIEAYNHYLGSKKLVIVGALEPTSYVSRLEKKSSDRVLFTDAVYDKRFLDSLRQGCFIYVHGHSVGGTNPSLLEAMAAGCACICHFNAFNQEVTGGNQMYFRSSSDLAIMLNLLEHKSSDLDILRQKAIERVHQEYTWEKICATYIRLFNRLYEQQKRSVGS